MDMLERVHALIKHKGWNISEFERRLGKSTGTFNGWRNRKMIPPKLMPEIADILNTSEAYLRGETDNPLPAFVAHRDGSIAPIDTKSPEIKKLLLQIEKMTEEELRLMAGLAETINKNKEK